MYPLNLIVSHIFYTDCTISLTKFLLDKLYYRHLQFIVYTCIHVYKPINLYLQKMEVLKWLH